MSMLVDGSSPVVTFASWFNNRINIFTEKGLIHPEYGIRMPVSEFLIVAKYLMINTPLVPVDPRLITREKILRGYFRIHTFPFQFTWPFRGIVSKGEIVFWPKITEPVGGLSISMWEFCGLIDAVLSTESGASFVEDMTYSAIVSKFSNGLGISFDQLDCKPSPSLPYSQAFDILPKIATVTT